MLVNPDIIHVERGRRRRRTVGVRWDGGLVPPQGPTSKFNMIIIG